MNAYFQVCVADVEEDADLHALTAAVSTAIAEKLPFNAITAELEDLQ